MTRENDEFYITRHSKAEYKLNEGIIKSENPENSPDAEKQWFNSDLTPEGKVLAKEKAEEFFSKLDPETDALFFVSSDLIRAAETAKIYLDIAREQGFEILPTRTAPRSSSKGFPRPKNKVEEIGEGDIRKINCLTLDHLENMLREQVFQPNDYLKIVAYPENVSNETKEKWAEARKIIEADNRGSWGGNYSVHSDEITKIFPNVKSAKEIYETKFKKMLKLIKFGQGKINEAAPRKNIKVLAFSHENSLLYFLKQNFGGTIDNCESIAFKVDMDNNGDKGGTISAAAKGKTIELKDEI